MTELVTLAWIDLVQSHVHNLELPHGIEISDMHPMEGEARIVLPKGVTLRRIEFTNHLSEKNNHKFRSKAKSDLEGRVHCIWKLPFTLPRPLPLFISGGHNDFEVELWIDTPQDPQ